MGRVNPWIMVLSQRPCVPTGKQDVNSLSTTPAGDGCGDLQDTEQNCLKVKHEACPGELNLELATAFQEVH